VAERAAQPASSTGAEHVLWEFAAGLTWADVPTAVQRRLAWLTLDLATVSVAARELPSVALGSLTSHTRLSERASAKEQPLNSFRSHARVLK